jgi:predicted nucleic acid-binding protein
MIDALQHLEKLYGSVLIPKSVANELDSPGKPGSMLPQFIKIIDIASTSPIETKKLDQGERDAISLALQLKASLILIDDRNGRTVAKELGLQVIGTLGILAEIAKNNTSFNLVDSLEKLDSTNFRINKHLKQQILQNHNSFSKGVNPFNQNHRNTYKRKI